MLVGASHLETPLKAQQSLPGQGRGYD